MLWEGTGREQMRFRASRREGMRIRAEPGLGWPGASLLPQLGHTPPVMSLTCIGILTFRETLLGFLYASHFLPQRE